MQRLSRRILLTLLLLVLIALVALFRSESLPTIEVEATQSAITSEPVVIDSRALWNERGSNHYRIVVNTSAPPVPPLGWELTVQDGEIIDRSIIACDNPSEEYPEWACEPIKTYYQGSGLYTIDELFEIADFCIQRTLITISQCPVYIRPEFSNFSTPSEMYDAIDTCEEYLQSWDSICAVQYDPTYGYPREIYQSIYGVTDGGSNISVREFEIIE